MTTGYFVRGFQEAPEDPYHIQASACCKHYVADSMESTTQPDGEHYRYTRHEVDSAVTMQDLVDSYMRPFQDCVETGRRGFEELLTKKLDDVVRGEVVKFEGGGMCPISVFVPYFILWKNQKRVALDLHKKQCRDKGELRPISKFCFFHF